MNKIFEQLLHYYNLSEEEFIKRQNTNGLGDIPNPFVFMDNFSEKIEYLKSAIINKKKIVIYGDYDVDGITSTSIILLTLKKLNIDAGYFIPSRYVEGYGITQNRIDQFIDKKYDLIITVDNGVNASDEISYARDNGIDVFVIDHHEILGDIPNANYIVHQSYCHYVDYNISAAFLSLLVSYGLLGYYDDYLLSLAGIAVLSDMMPMVKANLALVNIAINRIRKNKYLQYKLLEDRNNNDIDKISYIDISFDIIAPLNGIGRYKKGLETNKVVSYLVSSSSEEITSLFKFISENDDKKKNRLKELRGLVDYQNDINSPVYIDIIHNIEEGLIGGVINSLLSSLKKPVLLLTESSKDPNVLVGSFRSTKEYNLIDSLAHVSKYLISSGGHQNACGLTIKKENYEELRKGLNDYFSNFSVNKDNEKYLVINENDINFETIKIIDSFGPFGTQFEYPHLAVFVSKKDIVNSCKNDSHLISFINNNSRYVFFSYDKSFDLLPNEQMIYFVGTLKESIYKNQHNCDFIVSKFVEKKDVDY